MLTFISELELRAGLFSARSHQVGQGTEQQEEEGWVNPSEPPPVAGWLRPVAPHNPDRV